MPLGPERLLELVRTQNLVENLSARELENPEGAGFDLRMGKVYTIEGDGFLGIEERRTPKVTLVAEYKEGEESTFHTLKPDDYVLVSTVESVHLPKDLTGHIFPRTTGFRSGIAFFGSQVAPGYEGELTFALKNVGPCTITIELGARAAHIQFEEVDGGGSMYRGQWQGGRIAATEKEKQV